jgi:putative transposase
MQGGRGQRGAWLVTLAGMPLKAHPLIEFDGNYGVHKFVKTGRGRMSLVLSHESPSPPSRLPTPWTKSYLVNIVASVPLAVVKQYVKHQRSR